jgi:hypothetical protein
LEQDIEKTDWIIDDDRDLSEQDRETLKNISSKLHGTERGK